MKSLISHLRRVLVAFAVLAGLMLPFFANVTAADASTRHHTCSFGRSHSWYRHNHPYWWTHHCPRMAAALAGHGTAAAHLVRTAPSALGTATEQSIAVATLNLINVERHAYRLQPLTMDPALVVSGQHHNWMMAHYNTMSHQLPGEADLGTRIDAVGYHWMWAGENVAWNSAITGGGVLALQNMMYHETAPNDGHRLNILSSHFTSVGVNVYIDAAHGKVWLTTDFGSK